MAKNIKIYEKAKQCLQVENLIPTSLVLSILGSAALIGKLGYESQKDKKIYLIGINKDKIELLDENGNIIPLKIDKTDHMFITAVEKFRADELIYEVTLSNSNGQMQKGYLKGKDIKGEILDEEEVPNDFIKNLEVNVVATKDGCWLRENITVDRNTDDAYLIPNGMNVLSSSICYKVDDNEYSLKKAIYINPEDKSFKSGYMFDGYILCDDFEKANGDRYTVSVSDIGLNIRSSATTEEDNIISNLPDGEEVILVPNIESISTDGINWFYDGYKDETGKLNFGYCASVVNLGNGEEYTHLVKKKSDIKASEYDDLGKQIFKQVNLDDFSEDVTLKLRTDPGINSKIAYELYDECKVYTYEYYLNNLIPMDGHKWLKVFLVDGQTGYVASEYLEDIMVLDTQGEEKENREEFMLNSGSFEGYFGVDVNNIVSPKTLEALITKKYNYVDDYPVMNTIQKVDFAIIKIGASGWGTDYLSFAEEPNNNVELVNTCEKNNVPYGLYYFSQCTTFEEAGKEAERICSLVDELDINSKQLNLLPLYIDIECYGYADGMSYDTRVCRNASMNSKTNQTSVVNYLMNLVREKTGLEVCLYTDNNTLDTTLNFSELDESNKENCWIVEVSETHSINYHSEVFAYSKIRQTDVDQTLFVGDNSIGVDFDVMESSYYNKLLQKKIG